MGALETLRHWLSPILDPFGGLPAHLQSVQQNHLDSLNTFQSLTNALLVAPPGQQFSGSASDQMFERIAEYLRTESQVSAVDGVLPEIATATTTCVADLEVATVTLATSVEDDVVITEVTEAVDLAAAVEVGANPIMDVLAGILTAVTTVLYFAALVAFGWAVSEATQALINALSHAGDKSYPSLPKLSHVPQNNLTPAQKQLAETLAKEYGLSVEEVEELMALDPNATEAELRKRIERYLQLRGQYPTLAKDNPEWLLWAAAFNLSDKAVAFLADLNNGKTSTYVKGKPLEEVAADVLAAVLGNLAVEANAELIDLIQQAKAAKAKGIPLDQAIQNWDELPDEVKKLLEGKGGPFLYQRGRAIESLVKQKFSQEYGDMQSFYEQNFGLKFNKALLGQGNLLPDAQITVDGHVDVLDITTQSRTEDKKKYNLDGVDITIVLTYDKGK